MVQHEFQAQIAAVRDVECQLVECQLVVRCLPRFIPQFVFVTQSCPSPPSPLLSARCRAMDDKDNLLSCLSPRVQLDWQLRLQHARTSANILVSFTGYDFFFYPRFLSCQLPDCHHKQSVVRILPRLPSPLSPAISQSGVAFKKTAPNLQNRYDGSLPPRQALQDLFKWKMQKEKKYCLSHLGFDLKAYSRVNPLKKSSILCLVSLCLNIFEFVVLTVLKLRI